MPDLSEYELPDGTTLQLSDEDAKAFPEAKKVGKAKPAAEAKPHEPVKNRARRN